MNGNSVEKKFGLKRRPKIIIGYFIFFTPNNLIAPFLTKCANSPLIFEHWPKQPRDDRTCKNCLLTNERCSTSHSLQHVHFFRLTTRVISSALGPAKSVTPQHHPRSKARASRTAFAHSVHTSMSLLCAISRKASQSELQR